MGLRGTYSFVFNGADRYSPKHLGSAILNYHRGKFNGNVSATYSGSIASMFGQDGYALLGTALSYKVSKDVTLKLVGKNLLDDRFLSPGEGGFFTPNRGISAFAEVLWEF